MIIFLLFIIPIRLLNSSHLNPLGDEITSSSALKLPVATDQFKRTRHVHTSYSADNKQYQYEKKKMRIGLVCPGYPGHLNPTSTLATALQRRGHQVVIVSTPQASVRAKQAKLEFVKIGEPEYRAGLLASDLQTEGRLQGLLASRHTLQLFKREESFILRDLPAVIENAGLDALCVDQLLPAAMGVADSLRMPYAVLCNALPLHLESGVPPFVTNWRASGDGRLSRLRNVAANHLIVTAAAPLYSSTRLNNKHRARNRWSCDQNVGQIQIAQIPSFLDFPREQLPHNFFYSMPWHEEYRDEKVDFPWNALDGRPIVYVSLGTVQNRLEKLYLSVAEACSDLDTQVVLSLGRKGATLSAKPPRGTIVVEYAPQLELLRRASVVVTHAGMNTALEAVANGLPMVAVPVCNDQPGVAARLARVGVAEVVPARRASPANVRAAIVRVLEDPSYRAASVRLQQLIQSGPTLEQTAELIEVGLSRSEPLQRKDPEAHRILGTASKNDERLSSKCIATAT